MGFLAPLFLAAAAAIAVPVIYHMIRRSTNEKKLFSSLMFLQESPPRLTRKSRLENILLLILRCLVLLLMAAAFARPFFRKEDSALAGNKDIQRVVILVDASASMRRGSLWTDAQQTAVTALKSLGPADEASLLTFGGTTHPVVTFEDWAKQSPGSRAVFTEQQLMAQKPTWESTRLGAVLTQAADLIDQSARKESGVVAGKRKIILVTDLQEGSHLEGLQGFQWPKGVEVEVKVVKSSSVSNAGIHPVVSRAENQLAAGQARFLIVNASGSKEEQFKVSWFNPQSNQKVGTPADVYVAPGQSRTIVLTAPPGASNSVSSARLEGDEEPFDNVAWSSSLEPTQVKVLYSGPIEGGEANQSLFFLQRALQSNLDPKVEVLARSAAQSVSTRDLEGAAITVLTGQSGDTAAVKTWLEAGHVGLLAASDAAAQSVLQALVGDQAKIAGESEPRDFYLLRDVDFQHPVLAPFADPRFSDFTKIHFWKYRRLELATNATTRVLMRFDSGDPALTELAVGKGRLYVLATTWKSADSQLALSSKFVPLLFSLLEQSGAVSTGPVAYKVGDPVILPRLRTGTAAALTVKSPSGATTPGEWAGTFRETTEPGMYTVLAGSTVAGRFAVNLDPSESRTSPLPVEELEKLGVPLKLQPVDPVSDQKKKIHLANTEVEARQKLWRWAIAGALLLVIAETILAARKTQLQTA